MIQEYKCPCCGGTISFVSTTQMMKCPYCSSEFSPASLKEYDKVLAEEKERKEEENFSSSSSQWQEDGLMHYICPSCGGEIITTETLVSTKCPYCSNNVILMDKITGVLKPDYIIPFKSDKNEAIKAFKNHLKGKKLLPSLFLESSHIESIQGVYVPFWLFSSTEDGFFTYRAKRIRVWSDPRFVYTKTDYYLLRRVGGLSFKNIAVDGSKKMDDSMMDSLSPYDFSSLIPFQSAYLSGFLADRYDVESSICQKRAIERAKNTTESFFRKTTDGFSDITPETEKISTLNGECTYALLPVWLLNTKWMGKNYLFAMNGQTGKFVGDLPLDKRKQIRMFALYGGLSTLISFLIFYLVHLF